MGLFNFFSKKKRENKTSTEKRRTQSQKVNPIKYEEQLKVFKSLGYDFHEGVTKKMILRDIYEMTWEEETEKYIEENPFSVLYYAFGWRAPEVPKFNYSEHCIWFDLEFFDSNAQYKWFMERMGAITNGEIKFDEIGISTDEDKWEWIEFKVNGISKKWRLERTGYIANDFVQKFSHLPQELKTKRKYTYFDNGGQQFVIDFASDEEQIEFNKKTGLSRKWLGDEVSLDILLKNTP
ncbi:MAG: hypothetical protein AAF573_12430 [Bacteroidota bacterium]